MNVTGIEQGQGPLAQVANALSSSSKPTTAVQRTDDEKNTSPTALDTGRSQLQQDRVEISKAAQALAEGQFSSQQGFQQQPPSPFDSSQ